MLKNCLNKVVHMFSRILWLLVNCIRKTIRRALCFRRVRRQSDSEEDTPALTAIGIVSSNTQEISVQEWNNWDEPSESKPNAIEQHIQMYRQQRANLRTQSQKEDDEENTADYFVDMTPRITKQTKVLLKKPEIENETHSNFAVRPDSILNPAELGEWEETQTWEDQVQPDEWNLSDALREQKRYQREKKMLEQLKKKEEKIARLK